MMFGKKPFYKLDWDLPVAIKNSLDETHIVVIYNNTKATVLKNMHLSKITYVNNFRERQHDKHPSIGLRPFADLILIKPSFLTQIKNVFVKQPLRF